MMAKAKLLTVTAKSVADNWDEQYPSANRSPDKQDIYLKLCSLPESASMKTINEVIGNDSWTTGRCAGCDRRF